MDRQKLLPVVMPDDETWRERVKKMALAAGFSDVISPFTPGKEEAWHEALRQTGGLGIQRLPREDGSAVAVDTAGFRTAMTSPGLYIVSTRAERVPDAEQAIQRAIASLTSADRRIGKEESKVPDLKLESMTRRRPDAGSYTSAEPVKEDDGPISRHASNGDERGLRDKSVMGERRSNKRDRERSQPHAGSDYDTHHSRERENAPEPRRSSDAGPPRRKVPGLAYDNVTGLPTRMRKEDA